MSNIQVTGHVQHLPGNWGLGKAIRNATIDIIDVDPLPGQHNEIIWSGTTDNEGNFSGQSSEWQDRLKVWVVDSIIPPKGHWRQTNNPDPTDVLLLKLRVRQAGHTHEVLPYLNSAAIPVIVPWGPPTAITKNTRALVVVNNTVTLGRQDLKDLYKFIENSGDVMARGELTPYYKSITSLNGVAATVDGFCNALRTASQLAGVHAVDAIINMHGSDGVMFFADGGNNGIPVATVQTKLAALGLQSELRLAYNTCCYGATHAAALVGGGFSAAIGSRKTNANSESEYPLFLSLWAAGLNINDALNIAQAPALREPADAIATNVLNFKDVDSFKTIAGIANLTIESAG
jgi:hypothetical protein